MAYSTEEWISAYMVMKQEIEEEEAQIKLTKNENKNQIIKHQGSNTIQGASI